MFSRVVTALRRDKAGNGHWLWPRPDVRATIHRCRYRGCHPVLLVALPLSCRRRTLSISGRQRQQQRGALVVCLAFLGSMLEALAWAPEQRPVDWECPLAEAP